MKEYLLAALFSLLLTVLSGFVAIPLLKKIKAGQPVYKYVEAHKDKNGTPTMGGLFFIIAATTGYFCFFGFGNNIANVSLVIGLAFMIVGFLDDFIKIRYRKNEGLKPYQKIVFQVIIASFAGYYSYRNSLTYFYIPFYKERVDFGIMTVFVVAVAFVAITNSVNLTDGLDGLAGFTVIPYLIVIAALIHLEYYNAGTDAIPNEYGAIIGLSLCLVGGVSGFLFFNINKAKIFMGDTGSLSLGGFLGAISLFSSNGLFIPIVGIMFVLSSISVIVQVAYFKKTGKRVFLMAPLHHHFEIKGKTESQIAYSYGLITAIVGCVSVLFYL